ncbi:MAG TPA: riboflavin synthase [Caldithrix sp.]|nr:riboflavin synthase [Calditrichaceae bacterium]HEM48729.1 riboflavin synthase [Caldithrix sp.]
MFTGIIEEIGKIKKVERISGGFKINISAKNILNDMKADDSLSVNGVCLTVAKRDDCSVWCDAVGETLEKSTLALIKEGAKVNLERALKLSDRLGGHIVQGHVNGIGEITQIIKRGENYYIEIFLPAHINKYIVEEGSITVNGVSLTIAKMNEARIGLSIIPHTWQHTTFSDTKIGEKVNIETDILARYVEKILNNSRGEEKYSKKWFEELGY